MAGVVDGEVEDVPEQPFGFAAAGCAAVEEFVGFVGELFGFELAGGEVPGFGFDGEEFEVGELVVGGECFELVRC